MKNITATIITLLLLFGVPALTSCISPKRLAKICAECPQHELVRDSTVYVTNTVLKDSIIKLTDSTYMRLWMQCDSSGRVLVKSADVKQVGAIIPTYQLNPQNALTMTCKFDTAGIVVRWLEHHQEYAKVKTITQTIKEPVILPFTKWQVIKMKMGVIAMFALGAAFLFCCAKLFLALKPLI